MCLCVGLCCKIVLFFSCFFFLCAGKFLEVLAKRKTSQALVLLLKAQPRRAILVEPGDDSTVSPASEARLREGGDAVEGGRSMSTSRRRAEGWRERSIEAALVQPGDVLRVLPGAQVRV